MTLLSRKFRIVLAWLAMALAAPALTACGSSASADGDEVTIGLLLPFTGADAATSSNFERAALYAASRVNQGGGIGGKRLRILSQDTHSELIAGQRSAQHLIDSGAKLVVGPESAAIAPELYELFARNQVALVSPLIGAGEEPKNDCNIPWFRLAPSARSMGEALAKRILLESTGEVVIVYADDAYNEALSQAVAELLVSNGGTVALQLKVDPNAQSYAKSVNAVLATRVTSVVLATSARAGALLVNEFDALSTRHLSWFLSPLLKTELFVANVAPDALDGALGVAPQIFDSTSAFPDAFARQWEGDQPLEGAYFYYDAIALSAFALARSAASGDDGLPALASTIQDVAASPGERQGWNQVELGLSRIRDGVDTFYSGLTGPILLVTDDQVRGQATTCGGRKAGLPSKFIVENGRIVNQAD